MSQPETAQVAAALTASMLGEAAANLAGEPGGENAARMLSELQGGQPVAAPDVPVSVPSPAAEAAPAPSAPPVVEPVTEPELPDFEPQLSEEYAALLEEPDFDEEAAAEVAAEAEENGYDESFDSDTAAQLRAKDKRIAWLEQQNANAQKGKWLAEAKRSFPLLATYAADDLAAIAATSRRGYAREAAKLNEKYSRVLAPALKDLNAAKEAAKAEATAEARQLAAEQWGLPAADVAGAGPDLSVQQQALIAARARNAPLAERLKILGGIVKS